MRALPVRPEAIARDQTIVRAKDRLLRCFLLTQGLISVSKTTIEGHCQITALHVPGDMPDLHGLHLGVHDSDIRTLTDCVVATMDHEALQRLCAEQPRIAAELWRVTLVDAAILRERLVSVTWRSEVPRTAHLLCELVLRLSAVGQCMDGRIELPLTPVELSEALGMSMVQADHALQELGRLELARLTQGWLGIHDWSALASLADFQPDYLHLSNVEALLNSLSSLPVQPR